jgi:hypothetical protein
VGEIKAQLESSTGKVILHPGESCVMGVITQIGNIIYDGSLKTQLEGEENHKE